MNLPPGVDILLLINFFVVERDAHWVTVTQSKLGRYPTTARQKQQVSSFCGLISAKNRPYVTFLFWYTIIVDEENRVVDCWHSGTNSLSSPAQVVCESYTPYFWIWAMEDGRASLCCDCDWVTYCIILVVAQAFNCSDDVSCQGVPGSGKVPAPIPNYLVPTGSGGF